MVFKLVRFAATYQLGIALSRTCRAVRCAALLPRHNFCSQQAIWLQMQVLQWLSCLGRRSVATVQPVPDRTLIIDCPIRKCDWPRHDLSYASNNGHTKWSTTRSKILHQTTQTHLELDRAQEFIRALVVKSNDAECLLTVRKSRG